MKRLVRCLILTAVAGFALAFTAALLHATSHWSVAASSRVTATLPVAHPTPSDSYPASRPFAEHPDAQRSHSATLEPALAKTLAAAGPDERLNIIVEMREQVTLSSLVSGQATDLSTRRHVVSVMQDTAQRSQASIRAYLSARWLAGDVTRVTPFWIFNGLAVNGAALSIVRDLSTRPDVALIRLDRWRRWIDAAPSLTAHGAQYSTRDTQLEWGVARIRAQKVWSALGVSGAGVVVAGLDSGVDWLHPTLQASYRGYDPKGFHQHEGNWYDATGEGARYPVDSNGHGSHTMGTIVGTGGIGVAPGARWIAVRAFTSNGFALDSWLHAGFQWLLAPDGDPGLAPQVVNNSWGNNLGALTIFQRDINALRAIGIFSVFSAGNTGPDRGTVGSPASLPGAFAVGASDQDDEVTHFSSRGPSPWGKIRPHVVAPGVNVRSALPGGAYGEKQGTSMAAPHVAGTVALMLSAQPSLNITYTTYVLTSTAIPLTDTVPNNDSGYGRVDAYAAVALAANAGLVSGTVYGGGVPLPAATVRATPAISGPEGTSASNGKGHYQLFLGAGYYDLVASAFGYASTYAYAVPVVTGSVTLKNFDLAPLPTGTLLGRVMSDGGQVVEATVSALGTPVKTTAADEGYRLDLPGGRYTLEARALGYRVVTATVTVTAGDGLRYDFVLPQSMRVLLIDSGPWYYQSQVSYYRQALDDLSFAYHENRIKHLPDDVPTLAELLPYDLVIWSAPSDSPGLIGAGRSITDYLGSGGNLLVSGQDVAYWDGGGDWISEPYYTNFLHSVYRNDDAPSRQVVCLDESAFSGITLTIQGSGGANNQRWPDEIEIYHPDHATLACNYKGGGGAVVQAGFCNTHRALVLGFGFEAINDAADRAEFLDSAISWFASPRRRSGLELLRQTDPVQAAPPGGVVTHTFRLRNLGEIGRGDLIYVDVAGNEWPTTVLPSAAALEPCATTLVDLRVEVPVDVTWNAFDSITITAHSAVSPTRSETLVVTSKAPAPVLLVDDDRWFDQEQAYEDALRAANLPYDRWQVSGPHGKGSPPAAVLARYPIALWFTGYDWFDPLNLSEASRFVDYLEGGGRLFVSSQSALSYIGSSELASDYFGVISYSEVFSQTAVQGVPGHVLGTDLALVDLAYPFNNRSDSVLPAPGSQVAFRGRHGQPGALTREGTCGTLSPTCRWRTAFFAFPFEALPREDRTELMSRLVGWLSWLGASDLKSNRVVTRVDDIVAYTLTLRNDGPQTVFGAAVSNTLPAGTAMVGSPGGGAGYDQINRRVTWTGDLTPGAAFTFTYRLSLTDGVVYPLLNNIAEINLGAQGLGFQRSANVHIAAPDLSASHLTMTPTTAESLTKISVTLVIRNNGLVDALTTSVDNPLPWPLRLITGTLSSGGAGTAIELPFENRILWQGEVAVGAPVTLTYRATAPRIREEETWVYNATRLEHGQDRAWERGSWLRIEPYRFFFPVFVKGG